MAVALGKTGSPTGHKTVSIARAAAIGISLCRDEDWKEGLVLLGRIASRDGGAAEVPAEIYAYLGYGCARFEHQVRAGLVLCRRAIKGAGDKPDGYLQMARIYLMSNQRGPAVRWLSRGLRALPGNQELVALWREIGVRRPPVFSRLPRKHFLNRVCGRLRSRPRRG